jgi:hypothetical protein
VALLLEERVLPENLDAEKLVDFSRPTPSRVDECKVHPVDRQWNFGGYGINRVQRECRRALIGVPRLEMSEAHDPNLVQNNACQARRVHACSHWTS